MTNTKPTVEFKYEIKYGIPIPPRRRRKSAFPLADMKIGGSFEVPPQKIGSLRKAASERRETVEDFEFVTVHLENGNYGIWRVAVGDE